MKAESIMKLRSGMILVACLAFAAAAAGIPVRASHGAQLTGDEPHYLLTALSLAEDRNLDVSDEIERRDYLDFHEVPLNPQAKPLAGGRHVSPHDPLLPALLAAPAGAGGWVAAKVALAAGAGLLAALLLHLAVTRFGVPVARGAVVVSLFSVSAPLAVYGSQVYPELPGALAVVVAVTALTGPLQRAGLAGLAGAVIALPWLSVKFVPVAATLAAIALLRLLARGERGRAFGLAVTLVLAGVSFALAHLEWYGGLTPYASGDHFVEGEFSVVGFDPNYAGRARRLIGLLIDDRFGLVPWQPAWALAFPALGAAAVRLRHRRDLLLPLTAGWLTASFIALTMQGWWFPGRQIVVVLPLLVVVIAVWATGTGRRMAGATLLGAVGLVNYGWLVAEGTSGRITWVVDFFQTTSPFYRALASVSPDYLSVSARTWLLQSLWLAAAFTLGWWGWRDALAERSTTRGGLSDRRASRAAGSASGP